MFQSSSFVRPERHWRGYAALRRLVIFGDSYSAVGYDRRSSPLPTPENPLGVPFPGSTWASIFHDRPSWPGYLTRDFSPSAEPLLVYCYAVGGARITDVATQVRQDFLPHVGAKPDDASWGPEDTLFVTWVGINDCAFEREHKDTMSELFALHEELYAAGARNFLIIDLPPIHRTPAVSEGNVAETVETNMQSYNNQLRVLVDRIATAFPPADRPSVLYFSAWDVFNEILDHHSIYGFSSTDVKYEGGKVWWDRLHPTHWMHEVFAGELVSFLNDQPPFGEDRDR